MMEGISMVKGGLWDFLRFRVFCFGKVGSQAI